jgi:archaellum component FlaC
MMEENNDNIIIDFRKKIKKIVSLYEQEKVAKEEIDMKNKQLNDRIKALEKRLEDIENKYNNIKFAKAITSSDDTSHDAKIKVNRIVREIDKCIALLNR